MRSRRGAPRSLGLDPETLRSFGFLASLAAMIAVAALVGQPVALLSFVALYLAVGARRGVLTVLGYALGAAVVLYLIYHRTLHVRLLDPVFTF
ncbi:MAG: hypothetical protein ACK4GT_13110 [Pararhodobacter sp.]